MDDGHIVVDSLTPMAISDITYDLARESGFDSVDDLLRIAKHGKGDQVYLIRFHYLPPGASNGARWRHGGSGGPRSESSRSQGSRRFSEGSRGSGSRGSRRS